MKYSEYLSSAKRHNCACKVLKEKIEQIEDINSDEYNFLVLNLYYLSGYIIECSLKFKIFEVSLFSSNSDIEDEEECLKVNIDYKKRIVTHNFSKLQNFLESRVSDIAYTSQDKEVNKLLNNWHPKLRYEHTNLDYKVIKDLYEHTTKFLRKM